MLAPFWGDPEECNVSITRVDFDLGDSGMKIEPVIGIYGVYGH